SLQIRLPSAMTGEFRVESPAEPGRVVPYETLTNPDNSLDLVFHWSSQSRPGTLRIEAYIESHAADRGDVFQIPVVEGRVENAFLMISPEFSIQPADQSERPETLSVEEVPLWFQETPVFQS